MIGLVFIVMISTLVMGAEGIADEQLLSLYGGWHWVNCYCITDSGAPGCPHPDTACLNRVSGQPCTAVYPRDGETIAWETWVLPYNDTDCYYAYPECDGVVHGNCDMGECVAIPPYPPRGDPGYPPIPTWRDCIDP